MALIWNVDMGFNRKHFRVCKAAPGCRSTSPFWFYDFTIEPDGHEPCCERHIRLVLNLWVPECDESWP